MSVLQQWLLRWKQKHCRHDWRPAIEEVIVNKEYSKKRLIKFCDDCDLRVPLTEEQYFAEFALTPRPWTG